ncbi:MAG: hypothetical protein WCP06_07595 [Verrucomicrobiota bacterium]
MKTTFLALAGLLASLLFTGCDTLSQGGGSTQAARAAMLDSIRTEPQGNYYIGRRYYKEDYKFWGYIRKPGEPWSSAQLVMLNEQKHLAPDREAGTLGADNGYEYKLLGSFSGETVYEPASNRIYPEFVLTGYELRSMDSAPIFPTGSGALDPARRVIVTPY